MDLQAIGEELFVAVRTGHLVGQAILAKLVLYNAVGCQHHVRLFQLLHAGFPLVAVVHHDLHSTDNCNHICKWCGAGVGGVEGALTLEHPSYCRGTPRPT